MTEVVTTTTLNVLPPAKKVENVNPFLYNKIGKEISSEILKLMKKRHFKIKLYPNSMKPSCRGHPDGKDLPQQNESYYYSAQPVGKKHFYYGPLRRYNKKEGRFEIYGAYRSRWFIDEDDWTLNQADYGKYYKWSRDEYRIVFEPFNRAWNRSVIDIDVNGPIYSNDSLRPAQFTKFLNRMNDQEKMDTALLKRKHENQQKRKRPKTPSPNSFKKR